MSGDVGSPGYTPDPDHNDYARPKTKPEPRVGARVRVLGGGAGRIIGRDHAAPSKWLVELDHPSTYPTDAGRRYITRWGGELTVLAAEEDQVPS